MYFSTFNVRFVFHSVVSSVCVYTERLWIHAFIDNEKGVKLCPTTAKRLFCINSQLEFMTKKKTTNEGAQECRSVGEEREGVGPISNLSHCHAHLTITTPAKRRPKLGLYDKYLWRRNKHYKS